MELKKRGIVRALVVGGALATGWAFNSTDALAAEVGTEPEVTVENTDAQEEQSQEEESVEKMEDAVEVVEGDAVAEEGYLEQAQETIANNDLSNEAADELVSNGQQVLEQAQEKNEVVKNELEKVEAATEEAKAEFEEWGKPVEFEGYVSPVLEAETTEEKIVKLEEAEEELTTYVEEKESEYEELIEKYNKAKAKYDSIKASMDGLYEELQAEVDARQADLDAIEMELLCLQDELNTCKQEISDLESAMQSDEVVAKLAEDAIPSFEETIRENTEKAEDAKKRMEEIQAKLDTETDPTVREELERQYFEAENDYDEGTNYIALFTQGLETNKQKLAKANEDYAEHQKQHEFKSRELEELNSKYEDLDDDWTDAYWELQAAESDCNWEYVKSIYGSALEDAAWTYRRYERAVKEIEDSKVVAEAAAKYRVALEREVEAKALVERSEAALEKASATYDELTKVVEEYKANHVVEPEQPKEPEQPEEPEVTEVTTEKSFTTNISQKVRDIFTGFTVAIEATITTAVTTTKVNVAGNAVVKIYDRLGKLVTTLKDAGSFSFGFLGSFFGGFFKF